MGVAAAVDGAVRLAWPAVASTRGARLVRVAVAIAAHCRCSTCQARRHDDCQPHGYAVPCHAVRATGLGRAYGRVTRGSTRRGRPGTTASQARGQRCSEATAGGGVASTAGHTRQRGLGVCMHTHTGQGSMCAVLRVWCSPALRRARRLSCCMVTGVSRRSEIETGIRVVSRHVD